VLLINWYKSIEIKSNTCGDRKRHQEKPNGKRLFAKPKCIFENNIKIHFKEIGWEGV
jgi:hypothetical protein